MSFDRIWAGWRIAYIDKANDGQRTGPAGEGTLFERILTADLSDREAYVVRRGRRCSVLLNAYPYTNGHVLVVPNRAVAELEDLDSEETNELWGLVRDAVIALKRAYRIDGVNVGMNLGKAAGAGVLDHLHVHCVPRWLGDTNFMTTLAEQRVMPESLDTTWSRLTDAWPGADAGQES